VVRGVRSRRSPGFVMIGSGLVTNPPAGLSFTDDPSKVNITFAAHIFRCSSSARK